MFGLDYFSLSFLLGGLTALGASVFPWVYTHRTRVAFTLLSVSIATWSLGYYLMLVASTYDVARVSSSVLHGAMICIPVALTYFVIVLTKQAFRYRAYLQTIIVLACMFQVLNVTPLFVETLQQKFLFQYVPVAGPLYMHFSLYFFATIVFTWYMLVRAMQRADAHERLRLQMVLVSLVVSLIGFGSVFPYTFGIDTAPWPILLLTIVPVVFVYATVRQKLFSVQTIASELSIIALWIVLLVRVVLTDAVPMVIFEFAILAVSIVFGTLLIRNVHREVLNRERGERLARYLANANARLRELDKQKTEFVSLASHQLRGPIAAIVGYASLIQDGSYGALPEHLTEPLSRIFESGRRISLMVDDFLNVTRIEQGRMSYTFTTCDLTPLVSRVVEESRIIAEKKGLTITCIPPSDGPVLARIDEGKFAQVIQNLIDNAIKFTVTGSVTVRIHSNERKTKALVTFTDTGIGIAPEEIHNLSHKFNRASNANSVAVYGSGLGLYISKEILKAHDGWIYISSAGVGKGSVITVEVPTDQGERIE